ncbi:MAG: helix-turn-helix domain-containing protein [Methylotenera sp.]|nr:helix-turn-helix domain-containing protein [Oligoflexia bacterium]
MSSIGTATDRELGEGAFDRLTWLDSKEAANYLRKTANALRIMVYRGYLRPRRFRRRLYFRRIELDRLLESSAF